MVKSPRAWIALLIMLTAIVGHTLVFVAIYRKRKLRTIPNLIILNLSIADFLFSAIVPSVHVVRLFRGETSLKGAPCYITGVASTLFCIASICILTFISIERYMATNYPIKHRHRFNVKLIKIVLPSIWCWSALLSAFPFLTSKYVYIEKFLHCSPDWTNDLAATLVYVILGFALPQIILIYCNIHVLRAIRKNREIRTATASFGSIHTRIHRERQISIITVVVVVTFLICWAPYCTAMVCLASGKCNLPKYFMVVALNLTNFNSCCHPFIYGVLNKNFRMAFKNILFCK